MCMMESWNNGRAQLLEQLTKVCDQIGTNLQAELNDEKIVRIGHEELRLLQENSASLEKLLEHNGRLSDELESCRAASLRVDGLEKENKRLAAELQKQLQTRLEATATPKARLLPGNNLKLTPGPSEPPSSATRIDYDETKPVTMERYQSIVLKYNTLCDMYKDMREARKKFEDALRVEKEKNKEWNVFNENQVKSIARKSEKIKRLEAVLRELRAQLQGKTGLEGPVLKDHEPASLRAPSSARGLFQEGNEIPLLNPLKNLAARVATKFANEAFESAPGDDIEEEDAELPRHRDTIAQSERGQDDIPEAHHTSSTEGDSDPISPKATEQDTPELPARRSPSPDMPIIISSRSLKKRKNSHESTEATLAAKVKLEIITSSPVGLAAFLNPNESLDLDDIGQKVDTPRKRRLRGLSRQLPPALSNISESPRNVDSGQDQGHTPFSNVSSPDITSKNSPICWTDSVLQPRSTNKQILPRTSDRRALKKRRIASDKDVDALIEDGELATETLGKKHHINGSERLNDLLGKPSPPKQALSPARLHPTNVQPVRPLRSVATSGLAREVASTSPEKPWSHETRPSHIVRQPVKAPFRDLRDIDSRSGDSSRPSSKGSMAGLFEPSGPSPRGTTRTSAEPQRPVSRESKRSSLEPLQLRRTTQRSAEPGTGASSRSPLSGPGGLMPPRRNLDAIFSRKSAQSGAEEPVSVGKSKHTMPSGTKLRQPGTRKNAADWEIGPDQGPLRARPVENLRLQDFKVNPNYNQGYNYAYRDVVRGEAARHALNGCTKPDCCGGAFRLLAEINIAQSPAASQEERDDELLHRHMGDNAYKLRNMTREERFEILLQAKAREQSNRHGRHRHAYQRPASPPGFWRADFPTTQEETADREKAMEKERQLVVERYEEAMRPGGAYIFRDE